MKCSNVQLVKDAQVAGKVVLDNLECVRMVLDRRETRKQLQHIHDATKGLVRWADAVLVPERGTVESDIVLQMKAALQRCDALICKPCVACGVQQSHDMRLVCHAASLPPSVRFHASCLLCDAA